MKCSILAFVGLLYCTAAVLIEQLTFPTPSTETRVARDAWLSGDGRYVVFHSESDFLGTGLAVDADGVDNVWRLDTSIDGLAAFTKVSNPNKASDKDAKDAVVSHDGTKACYRTNELGTYNIQYASFDGTTWTQKDLSTATDSDDQSLYCGISSDGGTIVFQSKGEWVAGMTEAANYQIYMTQDEGQTFTLVTPIDIHNQSHSDSDYPSVSQDGAYVAFRSRMVWPEGATVSEKEEAWIYRTSDKQLAKITENMAGHECTSEEMYALYQSLHGTEALENASVTSGSTASCDWAAAHGHRRGVGSIGVGAFNPEISLDGRFVVYSTNFDNANTFGTHETPSPVSAHNLFLYDRFLGMTWQITNTGPNGAGFKNGDEPQTIEDWCCPTASSSKQRGSCDADDELRGLCCWQSPCGFPVLNPHISGNGEHIAFVSDFDYLGTGDAHRNDLEIWNYHIPTSSLIRVTTTSNEDIDDLFPRNSRSGERIVWHGDGDYSNASHDHIDANQVAIATLALGCSMYAQATNYHASPDIDVCCEWPEVAPATLVDQLAKAEVVLTFAGNMTAMWERLPFGDTLEERNAFCEHFVMDVHRDLSCALGLPQSLVRIMSPATAYAGTKSSWSSNSCGDWTDLTSDNVTFTMTVDFLPAAKAETLTFPTPAALAQQVITQHGDASSKLRKGYLTKLLSDATPTTREVSPAELPDIPPECTSRGSCYSSQTHQIRCDVPSSECSGDNEYDYPPGYVGGSGCCHCMASCDFSQQSAIYSTCSYYDSDLDTSACEEALATTTTTTTTNTIGSTSTSLDDVSEADIGSVLHLLVALGLFPLQLWMMGSM